MSLSRRSLITGLISLVAAPAIVRASSLMPVKVFEAAEFEWSPYYTLMPMRGWGPIQIDKNNFLREWILSGMTVDIKTTFNYMVDGSVEVIEHE